MKKDSVIIILVLLIALAAAFALYFTFKPTSCAGYTCFQDYMASCARAQYINEEPEASWQYTILRRARESCEIRVTLLQAKEGDLSLAGFEGHSMDCTYPLGVVAYPDKDMARCHGLLKEDLQGLIIEKLHAYILNNLANVKDTLQNISIRA